MTERLLVVAAFDSQLKVASCIARAFAGQGWEFDVRVPQRHRGQMNARQVNEFSNFASLTYCANSPEEILRDCMSYSAILIMVEGVMIHNVCYRFYSSLAETSQERRPILITGFVGVGLFDTYNGYQRRLLSDVLFLNAQKDLEDCKSVCRALGIDHGGLLVSGLPFLGELSPPTHTPEQVNCVLFAGQPDVPERIIERIYVLEHMIEYARRHPDRRVLFKPRHKPGEKTLHATQYHYETLLESFLNDTEIPKNFEFVYGPIGALLEQCQLFITVSSTAIFEALQYDTHVALVRDLGITEKFGNNYFVDSGMLANFADLYEDEFPSLNWEWIEKHMETSGKGASIIYAKTVEAMEQLGKQMSFPYQLDNLKRQIVDRIAVEQRNVSIVRKPLSLIAFFLRRSIKERRIL